MLTSASCVEDVDVIKVWLGGGRLFSDPKLLKLDVRGDPIIHPGRSFRRSSFGEILSVKNNFALLQLSKPVNFRQFRHIQPACLPVSSGNTSINFSESWLAFAIIQVTLKTELQ